jgi:hypothetical protein
LKRRFDWFLGHSSRFIRAIIRYFLTESPATSSVILQCKLIVCAAQCGKSTSLYALILPLLARALEPVVSANQSPAFLDLSGGNKQLCLAFDLPKTRQYCRFLNRGATWIQRDINAGIFSFYLTPASSRYASTLPPIPASHAFMSNLIIFTHKVLTHHLLLFLAFTIFLT